MSKAIVANPCDLENQRATDVCQRQRYPRKSNDQSERIFLKGRECVTKVSEELKRIQMSKSMPELSNRLTPGISAEDDDVVSRRASQLIMLRHSGSGVIPPPGKFSQTLKTAVSTLPRSKSENSLDERPSELLCSAHHSFEFGNLSDHADSSGVNTGPSIDAFHCRPASVFSVWESIMTHSTADELGAQPVH